MDQRSNRRIWDGGYDGSESGDDLKPQDCDSNVDDHSMVDSTHGIASFLSLVQWVVGILLRFLRMKIFFISTF